MKLKGLSDKALFRISRNIIGQEQPDYGDSSNPDLVKWNLESNCTWTSEGWICDGDLSLYGYGLSRLPLMKDVSGSFSCAGNQLTSLVGSPSSVGGNFGCSFNLLSSLEGSPQSVGGDFYCDGNPNLISLDGIGRVEGQVYSDLEGVA